MSEKPASPKKHFGFLFLLIGIGLIAAGVVLSNPTYHDPNQLPQQEVFNGGRWNTPLDLDRWSMLEAVQGMVKANLTSTEQVFGLLGKNFFPASLNNTQLAAPLFGFSGASQSEVIYYLGERAISEDDKQLAALKLTFEDNKVSNVAYITLAY